MVILCIQVTLVSQLARAVSHDREPHIADRSSARAHDRARDHRSTCSYTTSTAATNIGIGCLVTRYVHLPMHTPWHTQPQPDTKTPSVPRNPLLATARRSESIIMQGC